MKQQIRFIAIKEGIDLDGQPDLQSKVMVTLFSLFAEIERELISMRTKEGLAAARASGKRLGRPKGRLGQSKGSLSMDLGLAGKRAMVTGGTRGIGRAIADELANEGCHVGICAHDAIAVNSGSDNPSDSA